MIGIAEICAVNWTRRARSDRLATLILTAQVFLIKSESRDINRSDGLRTAARKAIFLDSCFAQQSEAER